MTTISLAWLSSPLGRILFATHGDRGQERLCALELDGDTRADACEAGLIRRFGAGVKLTRGADPLDVGARLRAYLEGRLAAIEDLPVDPGGTPFQARVWAALRAIPTGRTCSYAELARAIGSPSAVRAVGGANGKNPIGLVIPCHRVIAADGGLGGYSAGLDRKRWLLAHEAKHAPRP